MCMCELLALTCLYPVVKERQEAGRDQWLESYWMDFLSRSCLCCVNVVFVCFFGVFFSSVKLDAVFR